MLLGNAISTNLRCLNFKIFWGSMPPDPPSRRKTSVRRFAAFRNFCILLGTHSKFGLDPRLSDLDRYADFIITALHTAVDKAIPKSKSVQPESNPISNETLALIKEIRKLRREYSQMKDPAVKNEYQSVAETS